MKNVSRKGVRKTFVRVCRSTMCVCTHLGPEMNSRHKKKKPQQTTPMHYCQLTEAAIFVKIALKTCERYSSSSPPMLFLTRSIFAVYASERHQISTSPKAYPIGLHIPVTRHRWSKIMWLVNYQYLSLLSQYVRNCNTQIIF